MSAQDTFLKDIMPHAPVATAPRGPQPANNPLASSNTGGQTSSSNIPSLPLQDLGVSKPGPRQGFDTPTLFDNVTTSDSLKEPVKLDAGHSETSSFVHIKDVFDKGLERHNMWEETLVRLATPPVPFSWGCPEINIKTVSHALFSSYRESSTGTGAFLPLDSLRRNITYPVVLKLLQDAFPEERSHVIQERAVETMGEPDARGWESHPPRRIIFAILVLTKNIHQIKDFIKAEIYDNDLPLRFAYDKSDKPVTTVYTRNDPKTPRDCFKHQDFQYARAFDFHQEEAYAPFFEFPGNSLFFYIFHQKTILPFLKHGRTSQKGGYGTVMKVKIHPAHHNYGNSKNKRYEYFAIKKLHSQDNAAHHREVEAFERLSIRKTRSGPSHLIPLELTYRHGLDYFLVFPWADGNLIQFWEQHPHPDASEVSDALWLISQCHGIAWGLRNIHNLRTRSPGRGEARCDTLETASWMDSKEYGRHGDIKPENILWFENYEDHLNHRNHLNHLVISDFGLAQFHNAYSKSRVNRNNINGGTLTYEPPDMLLDHEISQKYDIWSLGCVFLEFVSWLLLGAHETIDEFSKRRVRDKSESGRDIPRDKFFELIEPLDPRFRPEAKLKKSVVDWIDKLHRHSKCSDAIHRVLDLIQFTMLVPSAKHRWDCERVHTELHLIREDCTKNTTYLVKPTVATANPSKFQNTKQSSSSPCMEKDKSRQRGDGRPQPCLIDPVQPTASTTETLAAYPLGQSEGTHTMATPNPRRTGMSMGPEGKMYGRAWPSSMADDGSSASDTEDGSASTGRTRTHTTQASTLLSGSQFDNIPDDPRYPESSIDFTDAVTPVPTQEKDYEETLEDSMSPTPQTTPERTEESRMSKPESMPLKIIDRDYSLQPATNRVNEVKEVDLQNGSKDDGIPIRVKNG